MTRRFKIPESVLVVIHTPALDVLLIERADRPGYWQSVTGSKHAEEEPLLQTCRHQLFLPGILPCRASRKPAGVSPDPVPVTAFRR